MCRSLCRRKCTPPCPSRKSRVGKPASPTSFCDAARQILDAEEVQYKVRSRVGSPANEIARHVHETQCDAIIMGTRGLSPVANLMIGSVATKVIHLVEVPVTLIK